MDVGLHSNYIQQRTQELLQEFRRGLQKSANSIASGSGDIDTGSEGVNSIGEDNTVTPQRPRNLARVHPVLTPPPPTAVVREQLEKVNRRRRARQETDTMGSSGMLSGIRSGSPNQSSISAQPTRPVVPCSTIGVMTDKNDARPAIRVLHSSSSSAYGCESLGVTINTDTLTILSIQGTSLFEVGDSIIAVDKVNVTNILSLQLALLLSYGTDPVKDEDPTITCEVSVRRKDKPHVVRVEKNAPALQFLDLPRGQLELSLRKLCCTTTDAFTFMVAEEASEANPWKVMQLEKDLAQLKGRDSTSVEKLHEAEEALAGALSMRKEQMKVESLWQQQLQAERAERERLDQELQEHLSARAEIEAENKRMEKELVSLSAKLMSATRNQALLPKLQEENKTLQEKLDEETKTSRRLQRIIDMTQAYVPEVRIDIAVQTQESRGMSPSTGGGNRKPMERRSRTPVRSSEDSGSLSSAAGSGGGGADSINPTPLVLSKSNPEDLVQINRETPGGIRDVESQTDEVYLIAGNGGGFDGVPPYSPIIGSPASSIAFPQAPSSTLLMSASTRARQPSQFQKRPPMMTGGAPGGGMTSVRIAPQSSTVLVAETSECGCMTDPQMSAPTAKTTVTLQDVTYKGITIATLESNVTTMEWLPLPTRERRLKLNEVRWAGAECIKCQSMETQLVRLMNTLRQTTTTTTSAGDGAVGLSPLLQHVLHIVRYSAISQREVHVLSDSINDSELHQLWMMTYKDSDEAFVRCYGAQVGIHVYDFVRCWARKLGPFTTTAASSKRGGGDDIQQRVRISVLLWLEDGCPEVLSEIP
eukprot:PhF_6_TR26115/c1_g1_i1/m.36951